VHKQFWEAKNYGELEDYRDVLWSELQSAERDVIQFLNDDALTKKHKMDDNDPEGWKIWRESSDRYSVLNYFYNRRV
jgi:hypothetical protein